ncbi:hypothetical protein FRB95_012115 [Tulasnella sp. JGI-2019a]|nr:hypothetical protein FRB95_012115 [Tulasnella sp. JGI-2019a]
MLYALLNTALLLLAIKVVYRYLTNRSSLPYPPGPPGDFIIGHLRQVPSKYPWLVYTAWAHKYGPINYINLVGEPIVIVNTHEVALDLLEKRSAIYSGRPRFVMACELGGLDQFLSLMDSSPGHKKQRKIMAQALHPRVVARDFAPIQERFAHQLTKDLLDSPDSFKSLFERSMGNIIQTIAYGEDDGDIDFVELGRSNMSHIHAVVRGYIVEWFPWLKYIPEWFPGARFQRVARTVKEVSKRAQWLPYNMVKAKVANGTATPSYVVRALDVMESSGDSDISEELISMTATVLFTATTEQLSGTLSTFILAMLLHHDVQARVQDELDRVFGDHLPTFANRESTPYLNAVITETFRWRPIVPIDLPHRLKQDDVYNGYFIPAGTRVLVNIWGILQNETHFPDPTKFDPDRFLSGSPASQDASASRPDPLNVIFGYGGRTCPGVHVAQSGLWIAMATILYCFDIRPKIDPATMKPMVPELSFTGNSIRHVAAFCALLKIRD